MDIFCGCFLLTMTYSTMRRDWARRHHLIENEWNYATNNTAYLQIQLR